MSKMLFTFKWGKSIYVTDKQLEKILLQYYKKTEVDEILKHYVTVDDLTAELLNYAELNYVEQEIERLDTKIDGVEDTLNTDIDELGNHVNDNARDIRNLESRVGINESNISNNNDAIISNKKLLDETVNELKKARLWNIVGVWNAETTYKIGDVLGDTETQLLYLSVKEPNLNHPLTEKEYWVQVSGVQQINLDDYYNKTQINELLNNYAKLDKDNTYANGKRNIFRTLPEVYTEKTLPTKNTEFTTKKYVDNAIANIPSGGSDIKTFKANWNMVVPGVDTLWGLDTSFTETYNEIISINSIAKVKKGEISNNEYDYCDLTLLSINITKIDGELFSNYGFDSENNKLWGSLITDATGLILEITTTIMYK